MSFVIEYRPLFSVAALEHGSDESLPGFRFAPTGRTERILADHQLRFQPREGGFDVYFRLNPLAADPLLGRITDRVRLSFVIVLTEPDFFARYEPDLSDETGPQLYLDNLTASGNIQAASNQRLMAGSSVQSDDAMKVEPPVFTARAPKAGNPTKFIIRKKFDAATPVLEAPVAGGGAQVAAKIDLADHPAGLYTIETDAGGSTPRTVYVDDDVAGARAIGVVDVHWESAQDTAPADGQPYIVRFQKR